MPYPGEILAGVYQVIDEIGKGGVGIIYRAYHLNLQKYVVLKKIKNDYVGTLEARAEVDILKSLHHSNLPQVYDFLQINNDIYTVMDFIDGRDLKYYLDAGYRFDESTLWYWFQQLCEVLEFLHKKGILHLDIKPANIMLKNDGTICLIDFNISLSDEEDTISGISPYYASPEQYRKWSAVLFGMNDQEGKLTAQTDIYSLGAVFYHLMTGIRPSADVNQLVPITSYQLNYSPNLVELVDKMMKVDKRQRFQSVSKIRDAVKRMQRTKEEKRTLQMVFFLMLTGILILLVTLGIVFYRNRNHVGKKEREQLVMQEARIEELCAAGEYETAYMEAVSFINLHENTLEKIDGAKSSFLQRMVEICMETESYAAASEHLKELMMLEEKPQYYHHAAVAAAYLGDYAQAEAYLAKVQSMQGGNSDVEKTKAEINASRGNYAEAIQIYQNLLAKEPGDATLRKVAVLALKASYVQGDYLTLAVSSYEKLLSGPNGSYVDRMNLVTAYIQGDMYEKALTILQEMEILYAEKYEVFVRAAILRYNMELRKEPSRRDFSKVKKEGNKALELYELDTNKAYDEQIETLRQLLETL